MLTPEKFSLGAEGNFSVQVSLRAFLTLRTFVKQKAERLMGVVLSFSLPHSFPEAKKSKLWEHAMGIERRSERE